MSNEFEDDTAVVVKPEKKVKRPKRYKVILLNDDYTTMEFVTYVLEYVFHKTATEAEALMMQIHTQGSGVAGVYSYEVAEVKVTLVTEMARQEEHPLRCIMEEE